MPLKLPGYTLQGRSQWGGEWRQSVCHTHTQTHTHTHTHTHTQSSISEPNKVQQIQFQTSGVLLFIGVQKLYGPEISRFLPFVL